MRMRHRFTQATALLLGALVVASVSTSPQADGLHARALDGDDLEKAWRNLVWKTWPGHLKAPRVSLHRARPRVLQAIHEMIAVLQFVDPYNYADDSPAWMATEESRAKAKEQSKKILVELGRGAAPYVWQALELEMRFEKPIDQPDKLVKPYRAAQQAYKEALEAVEGERRQDEEYAKLYGEYEKLRPQVSILKYLDKATRELRREKVAAKRKGEKELKRVEAQIADVSKRQTELGNLMEKSEKLDELKQQIKERAKEVDEDPKLVKLKAEAAKAEKKLHSLSRASSNLGQGLDPMKIGGDTAMITSELYTNELVSVLVDMGPEALPQVNIGMRKRAMIKTATSIQDQWVTERWAKAFALTAYSDRTKVALACERFLKKRFKRMAVKPLIKALPKATALERPALYKALRALTNQDLPDEVKAWTNLLSVDEGGKATKPVEKEVEDEDEE